MDDYKGLNPAVGVKVGSSLKDVQSEAYRVNK
jgi:hypothetical protein